MARVHVDTSVVGKDWFRKVLDKLVSDPKVIFTYTKHESFQREVDDCRKLGDLIKRAIDLNRAAEVGKSVAQRHIAKLEAHETWIKTQSCDDAHVFAMVFDKPTPFVFSGDTRMARCRDCMNKVIDKRYCDFRVVSSAAIYNEKRAEIHA